MSYAKWFYVFYIEWLSLAKIGIISETAKKRGKIMVLDYDIHSWLIIFKLNELIYKNKF